MLMSVMSVVPQPKKPQFYIMSFRSSLKVDRSFLWSSSQGVPA